MDRKQRQELIEELIERLNPLIESKIQAFHTKPSPETIRMIEEMKKCDDEQTEQINKISTQVEEIYIVFTSASLVKKAVIGIIAFVGSIMALIIGWKQINN